MNLNKGCIEIGYTGGSAAQSTGMNLNKGCIEIRKNRRISFVPGEMNLNKGCIEISMVVVLEFVLPGWTLTRVVLKCIYYNNNYLGV